MTIGEILSITDENAYITIHAYDDETYENTPVFFGTVSSVPAELREHEATSMWPDNFVGRNGKHLALNIEYYQEDRT